MRINRRLVKTFGALALAAALQVPGALGASDLEVLDLTVSGNDIQFAGGGFGDGNKPMIDFNQGGSKIYDDMHLRIETDDNLYLSAGTAVYSSTLIPHTTAMYDLGETQTKWKDAYLSGTVNTYGLIVTGPFTLGGAQVDATAAEIDILDGATLSTAELNILDGVTATAAELNVLDGITSTVAELNILDGVTSTAAELNILDGVTATTAELNVLDGITSTVAELNILDGVTSTAAELNVLDGVTATVTELNYTDGVTSAIQTQLDAKLGLAGGTMTGELVIYNASTSASTTEGALYYDTDDDNLYVYADGSFVDLTASAGGGDDMDTVYNNDAGGERTVLVDAGSVSWDLADAVTDYDFIVDIQGADNQFEIQDGGTVMFSVADAGAVTSLGTVTVGADAAGVDVTTYGATASSVMLWDASDDRLELDGADLNLQDSDFLQFGDAQDLTMTWDGTNLKVAQATANSAVQFGVDGAGIDLLLYGDTAGSTLTFDQSADMLDFNGTDARLQDSDILNFGDASDVSMRWDGTDFDVLSVADDGVFKFGNGTESFDMWWYGDAATNTVVADASASTVTYDDVDLRLGDNDLVELGDAQDVQIRWDATDLDILAAADDTVMKIGNGTNSFDLWWYGQAATNTVIADASAATLTLDDVDLRLGDNDLVELGDGQDVQARWDGTDLDILAGADDTIIKFGNGTNSFDLWVYGDTADDNIIFDASAKTLAFDGVDIYMEDSDLIDFGDAQDVQMRWDGTDFDVLAATDDSVFKFGNGTESFDMWWYGASATDTVIADASANLVTYDGVDLRMNDSDILEFGNAQDVQVRWDGTDLDFLGAADDYVIKYGNGTNSFDLWWYGDAATNTIVADASAATLTLDDVDLYLGDNDILAFGDAQDLQGRWDGTNFDWTDGTNVLMTITDAGTTGDVTVTGDLNVAGTHNVDALDIDLDATEEVNIDATSTAHTGTGGVLDIDVGAGNAAVDGVNLGLTVNDGATAATDFRGMAMTLTANDADADLFGLVITAAATANAAAGSYEAAISIDNAEDTGGSMVDAILIASSGVDAGVTDAIDASAANITNALNAGANTITGLAAVIDFTEFDVSAAGAITVGDGEGLDTNAAGALDLGITNATSILVGTDLLTDAAGTNGLGSATAEWANLFLTDGDAVLQFGADQDVTMGFDATTVALEILGGLVSIGADPTGATATGAGDLLVTDALEVDGATDLDGALDVDGTANLDAVDVDLAAGEEINVDATTVAHTGTGGVLDLDIGAGNAAVDGINLALTVNDGATAATNFQGMAMTLTANDADADVFGIAITAADAVNAGAGSYEAAITIDNADDTAGSMPDAIIVTSSGVSAGVTDAIDASASNITNAINVGANTITGTSAVIDFTSFDVASTGATTILNTLTTGVSGTGHTVIFHSDTAGDNMTWDDTGPTLTITGTDATDALIVADGNVDFSAADDVVFAAGAISATDIADPIRVIQLPLLNWHTDADPPVTMTGATTPNYSAEGNFDTIEWASGEEASKITQTIAVPEDFSSAMVFHAVEAHDAAAATTDDTLGLDWYNAKTGEADSPTVEDEGAFTFTEAETLTEVPMAMDGGTLEVNDVVRLVFGWEALDQTAHIIGTWIQYTATM